MMATEAISRMRRGVVWRSKDSMNDEPTQTKIIARPMTSEFSSRVVTASVGQIPSVWTATGLLVQELSLKVASPLPSQNPFPPQPPQLSAPAEGSTLAILIVAPPKSAWLGCALNLRPGRR